MMEVREVYNPLAFSTECHQDYPAPTPTKFSTSPRTMSTASNQAASLRRLFTDIGYSYKPLLQSDASYWEPFHAWMLDTLAPKCSWSPKQLVELEHSAGSLSERIYPYATMHIKHLFAKVTAIAIIIDDSIEDQVIYEDIVQFSHRVYLGVEQPNGLLALYHASIKELSDAYGNDAVVRGLAVVPWINFIDACLIEKDIFTQAVEASAVGKIPGGPIKNFEGLALKFPHYLRSKNGLGEAYAAGIFQTTDGQNLPVKKYIRAVPDMSFFFEAMNDLLSFHKEELAGETYNLIHLRTRALSSSGVHGSGISGEWTLYDTFGLLCDELVEATRRIDGLLRVEECERKARGESELNDLDEVDVALAKQWRGWRDGYISWHFECRRYKLDSMRTAVFGDALP
ncbi:isoprenoid synthase domain-containing protein [Mycena maculata]|uniref:Isoprenoid synthase domain-containing protein n=1 Tax=Mycena maculata TaxID=230809 RepID=A0AAD7MR46_9AGAR|nr:isoprenoid synthase domain-containing protein [Mycena maculata]